VRKATGPYLTQKRSFRTLGPTKSRGKKTQTNFIVAGETSGINENGRGETLFSFLKVGLKLMTQLVAKKG